MDVGGGIGSASLPILKNAPVKLIIQDKGVVIEDAENVPIFSLFHLFSLTPYLVLARTFP